MRNGTYFLIQYTSQALQAAIHLLCPIWEWEQREALKESWRKREGLYVRNLGSLVLLKTPFKSQKEVSRKSWSSFKVRLTKLETRRASGLNRLFFTITALSRV